MHLLNLNNFLLSFSFLTARPPSAYARERKKEKRNKQCPTFIATAKSVSLIDIVFIFSYEKRIKHMHIVINALVFYVYMEHRFCIVNLFDNGHYKITENIKKKNKQTNNDSRLVIRFGDTAI